MEMQPNRNMAVENQLQAVQLGASLYDRAQTQKRMMEQFQLQSAESVIQRQGMEIQNKMRDNALSETIGEQKAQVDEFNTFSTLSKEVGAYLDNPKADAKFPVVPAFRSKQYRAEADKMLNNLEKYSARAELLKAKERARNQAIQGQTAILREAMQIPGAVNIDPQTEEPTINWDVYNPGRKQLFDASISKSEAQTGAIGTNLQLKKNELNLKNKIAEGTLTYKLKDLDRRIKEGANKQEIALLNNEINKDKNSIAWGKLDEETRNNIARLGLNYDQLNETSQNNLARQEINWEQLNQNDVFSLRKLVESKANRALKSNQFDQTLQFKEKQLNQDFDLRTAALNKKAAEGGDILPDVMTAYRLNFGEPTKRGAANIESLVRSKNWKPLSTSESRSFQSDALIAKKAAELSRDFVAFEKANPNFIDNNQGLINTTLTDISALIKKETDPKKKEYLDLFQRFDETFNAKALTDSGKSVTKEENIRLRKSIADRRSKNFLNSFKAFAEITAETYRDKLESYKYSRPIDPYYVQLADELNVYHQLGNPPFLPSAQSTESQGGGSFEEAPPPPSRQGTNAPAMSQTNAPAASGQREGVTRTKFDSQGNKIQ